jgi:hypothetical protein
MEATHSSVWSNGGMAPPLLPSILDKCVPTTSHAGKQPRYPSYRTLGRPWRRSGRYRGEKISCLLSQTLGRPARTLFTIPIIVEGRSRWPRSLRHKLSSNPTRGTHCVRLLCVCVVLCATGWSPVQGVLSTVYGIEKLKKRPSPRMSYRAIQNYFLHPTWNTTGKILLEES